MSVYRYSGASVITEARFRYVSDRPAVALLSARQGASAMQLSVIRRALESAGLQCVPAFAEEHEVLQVIGFKDAEQLNALLVAQRFVEGTPQITAETNDLQQTRFKSWLQRYSLKAVGWLNIVGDIGLLATGLATKKTDPVRKYLMTAGGLYTVGAVVPALFGEVKPEDQTNETVGAVADAFKAQSINVPQDSSLYRAYQATQAAGHKPQGFLQRHAAQVMLGFYALGAAVMLRKGLKPDALGKRDPALIAYGANSFALKTLAFVLPEKSNARTNEKTDQERGPISKAYHWFIDKPLRLFGVGSFVSDIFLAWYTWTKQKTSPFMWLTTGTYLAADVLATVSSKNSSNAIGPSTGDHQRRIAAMVAETIVRQPEAVREGLVRNVAEKLARQSDMGGDAEKIRKDITEQLSHMAGNPWSQRLAASIETTALEQQPVR